MSKFIKEVSNSITASLQATTAVTQSLASTLITTANVVDTTAGIAGIYANDFKLDAETDSKVNGFKRQMRVDAIASLSEDKDTLAKIKAKAKADLLDDFDI